MKSYKNLSEAIDSMETILRRLGELSNLIETVHEGLKEEMIEQQALDCVICINYSIKELHDFTEERLSEINSFIKERKTDC